MNQYLASRLKQTLYQEFYIICHKVHYFTNYSRSEQLDLTCWYCCRSVSVRKLCISLVTFPENWLLTRGSNRTNKETIKARPTNIAEMHISSVYFWVSQIWPLGCFKFQHFWSQWCLFLFTWRKREACMAFTIFGLKFWKQQGMSYKIMHDRFYTV